MARLRPRPLHLARRGVQVAFLALTLIAVFVLGANAEVWCPFGGVEAAYEYITEGTMLCSLGVANFFVLASVLVMTLLLRRVFCGYVCPLGTISELLQEGAERLGLKPRDVGPRTDAVLRLLKYPVLVFILWISWRAAELLFRGFDPIYALISRHGKDITVWAYVVLGAIVVSSLFVRIPFCRWLCPMAAVMNPLSRFGVVRLRRHEDPCTGCGLCDKACPVAIPVSEIGVVDHARCYTCLECVEACPPKAAGSLTLELPRSLGARRLPQASVVAAVLVLISMAAVADQLWPLPSFVKERGERPDVVGRVELEVTGITCRGSSSALWNHLQRDDVYALPGFLRLETWPAGGFARVVAVYDPAEADDEAVRLAITGAGINAAGDWVVPDYRIRGYDPFGLGLPDEEP